MDNNSEQVKFLCPSCEYGHFLELLKTQMVYHTTRTILVALLGDRMDLAGGMVKLVLTL
jgi:hypothetical protein